MGLLDNLLNRDPTRDWQEQRGLQLILDVDAESFCGIAIGDPVSRLAKLGPAEDAAGARAGWYKYPSKGFAITTEQGRVVEIDVTFYEHERYPGTVRARGQDLAAGGPVKEAALVALLGQPSERKVEQEEGFDLVMITYQRTKADWQFEFDGQGDLELIWGGKRD